VGLAQEGGPARLAERLAQDERLLLQRCQLGLDGPQRLLNLLHLRSMRLHLASPPERRLLRPDKVGLQSVGARGQLRRQPLHREGPPVHERQRRRAALARIRQAAPQRGRRVGAGGLALAHELGDAGE
jgi:hypothetical protein